MSGISHGPQDAGGVVVQHRSRNSQENDADIKRGIIKELRRRVDEL